MHVLVVGLVGLVVVYDMNQPFPHRAWQHLKGASAQLRRLHNRASREDRRNREVVVDELDLSDELPTMHQHHLLFFPIVHVW